MVEHDFTAEQVEILFKLIKEKLVFSVIELESPYSKKISEEIYEETGEFITGFKDYNVEIGEFYKKTNQWELALAHFKRALEINSMDLSASINLGLTYLILKDLDRAMEYFEMIYELIPRNPAVRCVLGYINFIQGREREGTRIIRELVKDYPADSFFNYFLCEIYIKWQEHKLAIEQMDCVLKLNGPSPEAHFTLGRIYKEKREFDLAIKHLQEAISLKPDMIIAYNALGYIHLALGDLEPASLYFTRVLELNPACDSAYNNLGLVYLEKKEYDSAITYFKKALKYSPHNDEYHYNICIAYLEKGYIEKSVEHYSIASHIKMDDINFYPEFIDFIKRKNKISIAIKNSIISIEGNPSNLYSNNTLAELCKKNRNYDKAYTYYRKAIELDPEGEWKYSINTGDILIKNKSIEEALSFYLRALELKPDPFVHAKIASVYETCRLDLAINHYREALKSDMENESFYYYSIASAYYLQHSLDNAMVHYKIAMTLDPRMETICYYSMGICAFHMEDWSGARNFMEKAIVSDQTIGEPHYITGLIEEKLGKNKKARWNYEQALEKEPAYGKARYRLGLLYYKEGNKKKAMEYFLKSFEVTELLQEDFIEDLKDFIFDIGKENPNYLVNALKSDSINIKICASKILSKLGDVTGTMELLDLYSKYREKTGNLQKWLKNVRKTGVTNKIIELLMNSEDIDYERSIDLIRLLGDIKSKSSIEPLLKILKKENNILKVEAADALMKLKCESVYSILKESIENDEEYIKPYDILAMGKVKTEKALDMLAALLQDKDRSIRACAIKALGDIPGFKTLNYLLETVKDRDYNVRKEALLSIKKICSNKKIIISEKIKEKISEALIKILNEKETEFKLYALENLILIKKVGTSEKLIKNLKDKDPAVRGKIAELLGITGKNEVIGDIMPLLDDLYPHVREKAVFALGNLKAHSASEKFLYILNNDFPSVRGEAAVALGKIVEKKAFEPLLNLLKDSKIREKVLWALGEIGKDSIRLKDILNKMWNSIDEGEKITLAGTLGRLGDKEKKEFLLKATLNKSEKFREKAVKVLKELESGG